MKEYEVSCANPTCEAEFTIAADPKDLAEDNGVISECPECNCDTEFDYDPVTDKLTITPGQEADFDFEEEDEEEEEEDGLEEDAFGPAPEDEE